MTDLDAIRRRKRYRARLRRHGRCSACQFRELTDGVYHCRKWPERQGGCDTDGKLPVFQFDETVLDDLRRDDGRR